MNELSFAAAYTEPFPLMSFTGGSSSRARIQAAIKRANYKELGAVFDPLRIAFAGIDDFEPVWTAERGDFPIQFLRFRAGRNDGFLPLGDYARTNKPIERTPIMLVKSDKPGVLAHPTGFTFIADDTGSGNADRVAYYWPVAPEGYQALGLCIGINGALPVAADYYCVAKAYVRGSANAHYWSDAGADWTHHNGILSVPVVGELVNPDGIVLPPTTLLSNAAGLGPDQCACLVLDKLMLPIDGGEAAEPDYQSAYGRGTRTAAGVQGVAVLPCSVIRDPLSGANAFNSPFYYVVAQPFWMCYSAFSSTEGGTWMNSFKVGTQSSESLGFLKTTSLRIGAGAGVEAGGAGAHMAVSYTRELGLEGSLQRGTESQVARTLSVKLPRSRRVLIWQKQMEFDTYSTNGQTIAVATFMTADVVCTDAGPLSLVTSGPPISRPGP